MTESSCNFGQLTEMFQRKRYPYLGSQSRNLEKSVSRSDKGRTSGLRTWRLKTFQQKKQNAIPTRTPVQVGTDARCGKDKCKRLFSGRVFLKYKAFGILQLFSEQSDRWKTWAAKNIIISNRVYSLPHYTHTVTTALTELPQRNRYQVSTQTTP